ncbi:MAG: hypothetical protein AB4038_13980 [Prochloraceae cyanobacterium]
MEDWQKDLLAIVETVTVESEQFFQNVSEVVEAVTEEVSEAFETVAEELENTIADELDRFLETLFEPIANIYTEFEYLTLEEYLEETDFSPNPTVSPTAKEHPACIGCRHYHGRIYGGNLLVCGMHPYGWDDENCPDWQKTALDVSDFHEDIF